MATTANRTLLLELLPGPEEPGRPPVPVLGRFSYRSDRPYEVAVVFSCRGETVASWLFARELLLSGARGRVGEGDVSVWPVHRRGRPARVHIQLSTDEGRCVLAVRAADLADWTAATKRLVRPGTEHRHLDLDGEVARLLAATRP
ncbi:SsgA family sporulation/cell division regulator [Streptomyces sp. NPDC050610]|uniref:SsgA family sporulation/cell division regulator n=1 Tax=Streptomyces sp. NPDC050610 TaxID=3157097 RepID=UPI00342DEE4F